MTQVNLYIIFIGRPRGVPSKSRDASAGFKTPKVGQRRGRNKLRRVKIYIFIYI